MLIFVPSSDLSTDAALASSITELDLGYVKVTGSKQVSFRIGNQGASPVSATLSIVDLLDPMVADKASLSADSFTIFPGKISDTMTLTLSLPLSTSPGSHILHVTASTGETLEIMVDYVGANTERRPQTPERDGAATRIASSVIAALGDTLTLHTFHPVAYDPTERRRLINGQVITMLNGDGDCDPCNRLDPGSPLQTGYSHTNDTIIAQFQSESRTIRHRFQSNNTLLTYDVTARLIVPTEWELIRQWALFAPESLDGVDPERYKRTVYLIERQGEYFCVENIKTMDNADDISHFECDLISLKTRTMGSPGFFNPFSIVYLWGSDEPYAAYPCPFTIPSIGTDSSGSS